MSESEVQLDSRATSYKLFSNYGSTFIPTNLNKLSFNAFS